MKSNKSKFIALLGKYWPLFGYFLISLVFLFPILVQHGTPLKYDWGWPIFSMNEYWRNIFDPNNSGIMVIASKYLNLIFGLPSVVGLSPSISVKIFLLSVHTFAGYGFYLFVNRKGVSKFVSFISGIAYAFSAYIFIRTIVGFVTSLVAYTLLPFFIDRFTNIKPKKLPGYLFLGLLLTLIFSQIQAGILTLLFILFWLLVPQNGIGFKSKIKHFLLVIFSAIVINLPWFIFSLFSQKGSEIPAGGDVTTLSFIGSLPHSLLRILMLSDHHITYLFFSQYSKFLPVMVGFLLIYLIALYSLRDKSNRRIIISILIPAIIILPFSIGPTSIFKGIYTFVFNNFSYLALFRETYHFQFWLSFALISAFAFGLNQLFVIFNQKKFALIPKILCSFLILVFIGQYLKFNYIERFSLYKVPVEYSQLNNYLKQEYVCKKIYYPPSLGFLHFEQDKTADGINADIIAKSIGIPSITDAASVLNVEVSEMYTRNQLTSHFLDSSDNGEFASILANSGADCMIVRNDMASNFYLDAKIHTETDETIRQKWIYQTDMLSLARSKKGLDMVKQFGDNIYIFKISNFKAQGSNEYQNPNVQTIKQYNNLTIIPITSWATEFNSYKDGWSRGRYAFWRKEIFADLKQNFIYTTKDNSVLSGKISQVGQFTLLVRYLDGGSGSFDIKLQDKSYKIQQNRGEERFVIKDLGQIEIESGDSIEIKNQAGENAIADIVLMKN